MSKVTRTILPIEDVNFSKMIFEEAKASDYSKYMDMSFANYEQPDRTLSALYFKTPLLDYVMAGLPPAKQREGNEIEYKDPSDRAKWRCYLGDSANEKKMFAKISELQDKLVKDKAIIVGKKDEKKFELENILGESTNKEGESMYYVRFNFRVDRASKEITTKFFIRKDGIDEEAPIKTVADFESKFRRGEFRYRLIASLSKIWKQKKTPGKYGASFTVEQMLIEMRDDVSSVNAKNLFSKSQFDSEENVTNVTKKLEAIDMSKHIEDDDADEDADEENNVQEGAQEDVPEEDEEEEEELKPTKKSSSVSVKTTKAPRKKAST
jgi:hypothetical protein